MATTILPSHEELHQLLAYDPDTGKLFWKSRPPSMFKDGKDSAVSNAAKWNNRFAGRETFTTALPNGHRYSSIWARKVLAHRVIWKMVHGVDVAEIDHINGDPSDNRLVNLRTVSHQENGQNRRLSKNNTSGMMGVRWEDRLSKWVARINVGYKGIHLGVFDNLDEAIAARRKAETQHGFHENHGRAA